MIDFNIQQETKDKMGQLMSTQKQKEAAKIKADWSLGSHKLSEAEITTAALLASEGHLTSVEKMVIEDISITDIPRNQMEKLTLIVLVISWSSGSL